MKILGFLFLAVILFGSDLSFSSSLKARSRLAEVSKKLNLTITEDELASLIDHFHQQNLDQQRGWKKLLHIEKNAFGFESSQITDPNFFLAQNDLSYLSELEATVVSFFRQADQFAESIEPTNKASALESGQKIVDHSQHPVCRFPARLSYLRKNSSSFSMIWKNLPVLNCHFQNIFLEALSPGKIVFVFSSYYADSPGSAFGHTFFRVKKKGAARSSQELLDYGVSYAANVTTQNGFLYAMLGLLGGFSGSWTNLPYYFKVREYNDFEARDLWSYELNLTDEEVELWTHHMWEVGAHYYRYFFFSQNCAYHMLTVLEAAAPRLRLTDNVPFYYVIPSDSLKSLLTESSLISEVHFRPSMRKVFERRVSQLNKSEVEKLQKFTKTLSSATEQTDAKTLLKDVEISDSTRHAVLLDAALDFVDLTNAHEVTKKDSLFFRYKEALLRERARLPHISEPLVFQKEDEEDPSLSHSSARLGLFGSKESMFFDYRFALHDLLDPTYGLPSNSQLEFFNFQFLKDDHDFYLNRFYLFRVLNLNPETPFEKKLSWGADISAENLSVHCADPLVRCLGYGGRARFGYSRSFGSDVGFSGITWAFLLGQLRYAPDLREGNWFITPGVELGALLRAPWGWSLQGSLSYETPINNLPQLTHLLQLRKTLNMKWGLSVESEPTVNRLGFYYFY